jgi:hypothetical protein
VEPTVFGNVDNSSVIAQEEIFGPVLPSSRPPTKTTRCGSPTLPVASLEWIVLATDGAVDTARHLSLDDWEAIARCDEARLSGLLQHCREWEENTDPDGRQYPRAKRHDDKAIATIQLGCPSR